MLQTTQRSDGMTDKKSEDAANLAIDVALQSDRITEIKLL